MKKSKSLFLVTVLVYIFLIGPLLVIMAASFSDTTYLKFPGEGFTLKLSLIHIFPESRCFDLRYSRTAS